jgi:hypothetical protein
MQVIKHRKETQDVDKLIDENQFINSIFFNQRMFEVARAHVRLIYRANDFLYLISKEVTEKAHKRRCDELKTICRRRFSQR